MKSVLITGAAGYLGSVVLKKLQADLQTNQLDKLIASDLRETPKSEQLEGVIYEPADIRDGDCLQKICQTHRPEVIIHLAAVLDSTSMPRKMQYEIDVAGSRKLIEAALAAGTRRIILSSSGAAYGYHADNADWLREEMPLRGNDIYAYSQHKRLVEEMLAEYRQSHPELEQVIFRVGTILGASTDNLITQLFHKKRILGLRGYKSPFVFVWDEDVAEALRTAVFSEKHGIYNLIGDGAIANKDLARMLGKPYLALPAGLLRFFLRVFHPLGLAKYGPDQLLFLQYRPVLDNSKLKEEFDYTPQKSSLETFCYYLENQNIKPQNLDEVEVMYP